MALDISLLLRLLIAALVFAAVVLAVLAFNRGVSRLREQQRLRTLMGSAAPASRPAMAAPAAPKPSGWVDSLYKLSLPTEGWSNTAIRLKFLRAGFRQGDAPRLYFLIKTALTLLPALLVLAALLVLRPDLPPLRLASLALLTAALGYYAPDLYLHWRTQTRRDRMQRGLPDLVDLMVVALEAGMGLDQAMTRVARELVRSNPTLAEEFYLAGLEVRAGAGRAVALRNLALRVHLDDLNALVTMLNQSERFGTSLGESLRVQSEVMRVRRGQRAEEIAAKIPVKMLFPLIFCIFPSIMVVLIGPGWMQITQAFRLT